MMLLAAKWREFQASGAEAEAAEAPEEEAEEDEPEEEEEEVEEEKPRGRGQRRSRAKKVVEEVYDFEEEEEVTKNLVKSTHNNLQSAGGILT